MPNKIFSSVKYTDMFILIFDRYQIITQTLRNAYINPFLLYKIFLSSSNIKTTVTKGKEMAINEKGQIR
jgi:hypothetical protein